MIIYLRGGNQTFYMVGGFNFGWKLKFPQNSVDDLTLMILSYISIYIVSAS